MRFKCFSCNHEFDSFDENYVICPKCHSDNVAPQKQSPMKIVWWCVGIVIIAVLTYVILSLFFLENDKKGLLSSDEPIGVSESVEDKPIVSVDIEPKQAVSKPKEMAPIVVTISELTYANDAYSFEVNCSNLPEGARLSYTLSDSFDEKIIATSDDGKFTQIPPSVEDEGIYKLTIKDLSRKNLLHVQIIPGFVKQNKLVNKLPKEVLENMINSKNSNLMGAHSQISSKVKLIFVNLEDGEKKPVIFADIFNKITMGDWESVKVIDVQYNDKNLITKVQIQINHVEF